MIDLNKITRYKMSLNGTVLEEDPQGELVFFADVEETVKTNSLLAKAMAENYNKMFPMLKIFKSGIGLKMTSTESGNRREVTTLGGEHIGFIEDEFSNIDEETFNRIAKDMTGK